MIVESKKAPSSLRLDEGALFFFLYLKLALLQL